MLVDTSVWIDHFNGHASPEAIRLRKAIADNEAIVLCGIVLTEILLGLRSDTEARRIADLLDAFETAPALDRDDYCKAAAIYRRCRSEGHTIRSTIDCLIAQLCIRHGLTLLTKDRDFRAIAVSHPLRLVADS